MLQLGKLMGFLVTTNYEQARAFYEHKLGFRFLSQDKYALAMEIGGNMIRIVRQENFAPARNTVLGWEVDNIEASAAALKENGVTLEDYPFIQDRTLGIWTAPTGDKVAWFKDPDGNVLSISKHVSPY